MTIARYICRRGGTNNLQVRIAVPNDLRSIVGKRELVRSLGTTDEREAHKRGAPIVSEFLALLDVARRPRNFVAPVADLPAEIIDKYHDRFMSAIEARAAEQPDAESLEQFVVARTADQRAFLRNKHLGQVGRWEALLDAEIAERGIAIEKSGAEYNQLRDLLAEANIATLDVFTRKMAGELDAQPRSTLVATVKERLASQAKPGESVAELFTRYFEMRVAQGRKKAVHESQDRVAIDLFAEFSGRNRAVSSITKDEARSFREMLAKLPAGRGKASRFQGKSIDDCIDMAQWEGLPTLSLTTQAKYLSIVSPLFDWLVEEGRVQTNPFDKLHLNPRKGRNRRPPYSVDQLNRMLQSPLFTGFEAKGREHLRGEMKANDWKRWIPLLCLFTGSRITEVAQLHVGDIGESDGVPIAALVHSEATGQSIKNGKTRITALHPYLIQAGFLEYWRVQKGRAANDGNAQLFPEISGGKRELLGDMPSKWWRRYLEKIGIKDGRDGIGSHAFRHTLANAMRKAGFLDEEFGQLVLGHANNSITSAYGDLPQGTARRLSAMLDLAFKSEVFRGVDFTPITGRSQSALIEAQNTLLSVGSSSGSI